ncbi:MAG: hypothetical protein OQK92_10315 [Sedimenticola sp.]|nr:hypothetical protein [Sedimenticola sp.]
MKKLLITTLVSLFAVGSASADYATDINNDSLHVSIEASSMNLENLPATAAGRNNAMEEKVFHRGMQDHPSERPSGI